MKVVVIGGGPAGMMAAIKAAESHEVVIIDKNQNLGRKLFITGKGRCNITNSKDISEFFDFIPGNPDFLYSSLYSFTNINTINFFEENGIKLKVERGDRVFPKSDKSSDIIKTFEKVLYKNNVKVLLNTEIKDIIVRDEKIQELIIKDNTIIKADYFILCTGGSSYPQTGSTGDGYKFALKCGHTINKIYPALVPIEIKDFWIKELQGLSLKNVTLNIVDSTNKSLFQEFGEMIFTHYGISGPIVLKGSRMITDKKQLKAIINLKPYNTELELETRLLNLFEINKNKNIKNTIKEILPNKLVDPILSLCEIKEDKKINGITKTERKKIVKTIQGIELSIKGTRTIDEAIITAGGVNVDEIDPSTLKSKVISNLSFAGEVIDVDAYTGGYNLQIAISTGYLAGDSI
ncbi:BaiN/RdsA family NAD(P)/FAD-dependent oxidoreductase [Clostridium sp. DL1XJH146]